MVEELRPIDIGTIPELVRLVDEVERTGRPRRLRHGGRVVAMLVPAPQAADAGSQTVSTPIPPRGRRRATGPVAGAHARRRKRSGRPLPHYPKGGIVAATAGVVQYRGPVLTVEQERAAFERGVAAEVVESMEE
jgi:hypothetical protein